MGRLGSYPAPAHSRLPYQKRRGYNGPNEGLAVVCKYSPTKPESLGDGWKKDDSKGITKKFRLFGLTNSVPVYERYIREKGTECGGGIYGEAGRVNLKGHGNEPNFPRFLHKSLWPRSLTLHFEPLLSQ